MHLDEAERTSRAEEAERVDRAWALAYQWMQGDPACWDWPVCDADNVDDEHGFYVLHIWQRGRCATCGRDAGTDLVLDHDHRTALIRGYLCRGCNVMEGQGRYRIFDQYRERNPASMLDVAERYVDPLWGEAEPSSVRDYEPWRDNPMRNAGL